MLNDKDGRPLRSADIKSGKCKVFATSSGSSTGSLTLHYVAELNLFYVSDNAIALSVIISLVSGQDTTTVILPIGSERVVLSTWPTVPGTYTISRRYTGELEKPGATIMYPAKLNSSNPVLYTLAVLDWDKYRSSPSQHRFFKNIKPLQLQIH